MIRKFINKISICWLFLRQTFKMIRKNIISLLVAVIIMYLSLASSDTFKKIHFLNVPYRDKIVHFGMYFAFMSVIIFENRTKFISGRSIYLAAIIPLLYGILMEILQSLFTTSRNGNILDILINSAGIVVSLLCWFWIKTSFMQRIK